MAKKGYTKLGNKKVGFDNLASRIAKSNKPGSKKKYGADSAGNIVGAIRQKQLARMTPGARKAAIRKAVNARKK